MDYTDKTFDPITGQWVLVTRDMLSEIQFADGYSYTVGEIMDSVVAPAITPPDTTVNSVVNNQTSGVVGGGTFGTVAPGVVSNPIFEGAGVNSIISADNALEALRSFAETAYGSVNLGYVRRSSEVLVNEPSGIRPGTMERIVLPEWARRERGSPA